MNKKTVSIIIAASLVAIVAVAVYLLRKPSPPQTIGDVCRDYALAIEDVAKARDNLDKPSWDDLVKKHPTLIKTATNGRAITLAKSVSLRLIGANDTPASLKPLIYQQCLSNYLCLQDGICN